MNFWLAAVCIFSAYWYGSFLARKKIEQMERRIDDLKFEREYLKARGNSPNQFNVENRQNVFANDSIWSDLQARADFELERPMALPFGREEKGK